MKIFTASQRWDKRGVYEESDYVIVANSEQEALGMALDEEPKSSIDEWEIAEINPDEVGCYYISGRSS